MTNHQYLEKVLLFLLWSSLIWILTFIFPYKIMQCGTEIIKNFIYLIIVCFAVRISSGHLMKERISSNKKAVLITGCTGGFGKEITKRLDEKGFTVFATCRSPNGDLANQLRKKCSNRVHVIEMDVTKEESVNQVLVYVKEHLSEAELWSVVHCAGVQKIAAIEWADLDTYKEAFEINVLGMVRVTKTFLPLLKKSKGRVVVLTSIGKSVSIPFWSSYCMSKFAINAFCEALRQEMHQWGVQVISVQPQLFRTVMSHPDNVMKSMDLIWNRVPEDIKEAYGENYFNRLKKNVLLFLSFSSFKIFRVTDSLEDAIMSKNPVYVYKPAGFFILKIGEFILENLPVQIKRLLIFIGLKVLKV